MPEFTCAAQTTQPDRFIAAREKDIASNKSELKALESEAANSGREAKAKAKLQAKVATAMSRQDAAAYRAKQRVNTLKQEADRRPTRSGINSVKSMALSVPNRSRGQAE